MLHLFQKPLLAVLVLFGLASPAQAIPILSFDFIGSGQIVSPTDSVIVTGRITNTGDPISTFLSSSSITIPPNTTNNYVPAFPPGLNGLPPLGPPTFTFNLGTNESIDWTIAEFQPWPLTGNLGDPVPLGQYILPPPDMSYTILQGPTIVVDTSMAGDFVWTVVEDPNNGGGGGGGTDVPAPPIIGLILFGLGLMRLYQRS